MISSITDRLVESFKLSVFIVYQSVFNAWVSISYSIFFALFVVGIYLVGQWAFLLPETLSEVPELLFKTYFAALLVSMSSIGMMIGRLYEQARSLSVPVVFRVERFLVTALKKAVSLHLNLLFSLGFSLLVVFLVYYFSPDSLRAVKTGSEESIEIHNATKPAIFCLISLYCCCMVSGAFARFSAAKNAKLRSCFKKSNPPVVFTLFFAALLHSLQFAGVNLAASVSVVSAMFGLFLVTAEQDMVRAPNGDLVTIRELHNLNR